MQEYREQRPHLNASEAITEALAWTVNKRHIMICVGFVDVSLLTKKSLRLETVRITEQLLSPTSKQPATYLSDYTGCFTYYRADCAVARCPSVCPAVCLSVTIHGRFDTLPVRHHGRFATTLDDSLPGRFDTWTFCHLSQSF